MSKAEFKRKIFAYDFAIHELVLYLDTHPTCKKGMTLLEEYRKKRKQTVMTYEERYGKLIVDTCDVLATECWKWLESPWPWENNFMEG